MELRPYQIEAVEAVFKDWKTYKATLLIQATGTGKTIVFSEITKQLVEDGKNVLIIAHRDELIVQAKEKLKNYCGLEAEIEQAEKHATNHNVVISSVQTMSRRLNQFDRNTFDFIIIDEAHHTPGNTYQKIINYFDKAKILGVTATAMREDKKKLSDTFDNICFEYSILDAINDGYLCPIVPKIIDLKINLKDVKTRRRRDYRECDVSKALKPYLESIADILMDECKGRKTVVFLPLIDTSKHFTKMLNDRGIRAVEINGLSKDRSEILREFEEGKIDVLCNSMLLTEGWDCPAVDQIVNLRATKSKTLYTQIIGRGTRLFKDKKELIILDFLWQTEKYDLCKPASLIAENENELKLIDELAMTSSGKKNLVDLKEQAKKKIEEKLASELAKCSNYKSTGIDPNEYCLALDEVSLVQFEPVFKWQKETPTDKQLSLLSNRGFNVTKIKNKGHAAQLIDLLVQRGMASLATVKQVMLLSRYHIKNIKNLTIKEASTMIGKIADNGWKLPSEYKVYD